jgi:zinc protease
MTSKFLPSLLFSLLLISSSYALDGDMYDFFLPNGLKVVLMEKHAAPRVAVGVYYNVGSHDDPDGQKGITKIVKYMMLEGTSKFPKSDEKLMRELNAHVWDGVNPDRVYFSIEVPNEEIGYALDLESDRMQNIIITDSLLVKTKLKHKSREDTWRNKNAFDVGFTELFLESLPEGHPYKTMDWGIKEQIDTLSVAVCQNYYSTYFAPNNAVLVVVGDFNPEDATALIYQYFSPLITSDSIPSDPDLSLNKIPNKIFTKNIEFSQEPLYFSFSMLSFILPSARDDDVIIIKHIVDILERDSHRPGDIYKQYSKNRRLMLNTLISMNPALGYSMFNIGGMNLFRDGSTKKIIKSIIETFEDIGENGLDEKLLENQKKHNLLESYEDGYNYNWLAYQLGESEIIYGDYRVYNRSIEILNNLSNDDIKRVVKEYLHQDNMVVYELTANKKTWSSPFVSFVANQIVLRFWDPFH